MILAAVLQALCFHGLCVFMRSGHSFMTHSVEVGRCLPQGQCVSPCPSTGGLSTHSTLLIGIISLSSEMEEQKILSEHFTKTQLSKTQ